MTCGSNSQWIPPTEPVCQANNCSTILSPPANGQVSNGGAGSTGTVVYFSCYPGYSFQNHTWRRSYCLPNSTWSNPTPSCIPILCPNLPSIINGQTLPNNVIANTTIQYVCNSGYTLTGVSSNTCNTTGQWTSSVQPTCPPSPCPPLSNPINGQVLPATEIMEIRLLSLVYQDIVW